MPPSDMTYPSVSHSISCFPGLRTSASVTIAKENFQACLIEFLSTVQRCKIDFLPITWQEGLGILGRGGSGQISQAPVRRGIGIAFKRFHTQGPITALYKAMISEVLILSQPPIRGHPNIVNLEGVCWEIDSETDEATPVLVFEKATWDLQEYMRVTEGATMSLSERLEHCVDVGSAIKAMHAYSKFALINYITVIHNRVAHVVRYHPRRHKTRKCTRF